MERGDGDGTRRSWRWNEVMEMERGGDGDELKRKRDAERWDLSLLLKESTEIATKLQNIQS